ncbi:hypothetical protein RhiJN_06813 [Ceratobasidium sp. AG-Ba]|nr:hypothetical protein RhiJN_06813 [Ceratobasidium sp. AG-Ba]
MQESAGMPAFRQQQAPESGKILARHPYAKLIEGAQNDSKVLLDHIQAEWIRTRRLEQERERQLAQARTQPRDIECLRAPDPTAWNGLGRRKKRCRAFEAVGRAYTARQQASQRDLATQPSHTDLQAVDSPSSDIPTRPATPPGLRVSVRNVPSLLDRANGPADGRDYGWPSPPESSRHSTPSSTRSKVSGPDYPSSGHLVVRELEIDKDMAYIVARVVMPGSRIPAIRFRKVQWIST